MNVYYTKFIDFFKKHNLYDKEGFEYLRNNSIMFDYRDEEAISLLGWGCRWNIRNGKYLDKINLIVPFLDNDLTVLINIHEYTHGIMLYKYLGKKLKIDNDIEMLPMMYERLYFLENSTLELAKYEEMYDKTISSDSEIKYILGLKYRDELIEKYNNGYDFNKLDRYAKKLARRYK